MSGHCTNAVRAERAILAAFLTNSPDAAAAFECLSPADFFDRRNAAVFATLKKLHGKGIPTDDIDILLDDLGREVGDEHETALFFSELTALTPKTRKEHIDYDCQTIKQAAQHRSRQHAALRLTELLASTNGSIDSADYQRQIAILTQETAETPHTFHEQGEYMNAPQLRFAIRNFVQADAATIFGGLSGQGKTWVLLSIAKALLEGEGAPLEGKRALLWDYFPVNETADKIVYLIPESTIGPFGHRLRLFGLMKFVEQGKLLTRTLSKGPRIELDDPRILAAVKGAHVFLDTIGRWSEGDENSAGDNQRGLASDIFGLLGAGARTVIAAHHSPKGFSKETTMSLENCLRGSGDVGAMVGTAFGIRQIDAAQNIVHLECVKPRDFEPPEPFQLIGRPFIDDEGNFRMHRKPGECGRLADYLDIPGRSKGGGQPVLVREARAANIEHVRNWLTQDKGLTSEQLRERFKAIGVNVSASTCRKYKREVDS
jgi:hypothetical protein